MIYSIPKSTKAIKPIYSYTRQRWIKAGTPGEILAKKNPTQYLVKFNGFSCPRSVTADQIEDNP